MVDLVMQTITGGKERTVDEHRALLASAGLRNNRTIPISAEITMLETFPAAVSAHRGLPRAPFAERTSDPNMTPIKIVVNWWASHRQ